MLRCLSLTAERDTDKLSDIRQYADCTDAVEIRLDLCQSKNAETVRSLCRAASVPVILHAGGLFETAEGYSALEHLIHPDLSYIELPWDQPTDFIREKAERMKVRLIRTIQDVLNVPLSRLEHTLTSIVAEGDLPKLECSPRGSREALQLLKLCDSLKGFEEKIVYGRGAFGFFTRTMPWRCGSRFVYTEAGAGVKHAGSITPRELEEVYRISSHGEKTLLFGIIGNPVMHTQSPLLHNGWFAMEGFDALYLPFPVDDVGAFMEMAELAGIRGFSVTIPHKESIIEHMELLSNGVRRMGSCNTAVKTRDGWYGSNTDLQGFLDPLEADVEKGGIEKALVIGAGGAARTVVFALRERGIAVTIANRTVEKARYLAQETDSAWSDLKAVSSDASFDLVVQTTSVGMEPDVEGDPLPDFRFVGSETVYDIIYTPEKTRFLERAEAAGCRIIGGKRMLRAQAELQFRQFREICSLWA